MTEPLKQLGWANSFYESGAPEDIEKVALIARCREQKHKTTDIDVGPRYRGMDHVVTCEVCGYVYHYDSSD